MKNMIWDFWAKGYHRLWVQKYSLKPTRQKVKEMIVEDFQPNGVKLLDIGCGIGELLFSLKDVDGIDRSGLDFSKNMIRVSETLNKGVKHYLMDVEALDQLNEKFHMITCTHSLPYYTNQAETLRQVHTLLLENGRAYFAFASSNRFLDKLILMFVKLTTGPARYPSDRVFQQMIDGLFVVEKREEIRLKPYMPTIAVYALRKVDL